MSLRDATQAVFEMTGYRPHVKTLRKWVTDGCSGHYLSATKVGRNYFTNKESLKLFIDACNRPRA
jgi:hypothetical protein